MQQPISSKFRVNHWLWLAPLLYMVVVGVYFVIRYQGRWAETDTATFTDVIRSFAHEGTLTQAQGAVYPNGYAYQAISTFIMAMTGLSAQALQQLVYPLLAALVVLPAWLLYRELIGSPRGATLATIFLFTQPEFLFVILRSSHEKFTRALLFLCLFWLVRSFKLRHRPRLFATHVALFYLTAFALIASNNLQAHSFIFAIAFALGLGWFLDKRRHSSTDASGSQRLIYPVLICLALVYLVMFYIYPPARHELNIWQSIGERITALFLNASTSANNAYAPVAAGWISLPVYFLVSIANWIILASSFAIWAYQGWRWLRYGAAPDTQAARLLWLFYAAFAVQGLLSVVLDATGVLGGNLQHRLFPSVSIVAAAVVAKTLVEWRPQRRAKAVYWAMSGALFAVAILSVLKATNEPALSNKWTFYRADEIIALHWSDQHLPQTEIWTDLDERLRAAYQIEQSEPVDGNRFPYSDLKLTTRNLIITTITRLRSSRLQLPLPLPPDALRVYDNGEAQLYHLRPETPYQR